MSRGLVVTAIVLAGMVGLGTYFAGEKHLAHPPETKPAASRIPQALTRLPDFSLPDLAGEPQPSSRWAGKVLVLNFWATWCPPCRKEMPGFIELQEELGGKGLQFVGIAIDSAQAVSEFAAIRGINYPILIGDESAIRMSKRLGNRFQGLPFSVIFDRAGAVVYVQAGELKKDTIREKISALL
jgi:thiol-disulfide isomerase/thioredoxin